MAQSQRRKNQKAKRDAARASGEHLRVETTSGPSQMNVQGSGQEVHQLGQELVPQQHKAKKPWRKSMLHPRYRPDHSQVPAWQLQPSPPFVVPHYFNPGLPPDLYQYGGFPIGNAFPGNVPFTFNAAPAYQPGYLGAPVLIPQSMMNVRPHLNPESSADPVVNGADEMTMQHMLAPGDHVYYQPPGCLPERQDGTWNEMEAAQKGPCSGGRSANLRATAPEFVPESVTVSDPTQTGDDTRRQTGVLVDRPVRARHLRAVGHRLGLGLGLGSRAGRIHLKKRSRSV